MMIYGKDIQMVKIQETGMPLDKQAEQEYAASLAEDVKAVQDYNIMMGILEDPMAEEEVQ